MTRRELFAALIAPLVADAIMKTYPKWPHVISGKEINTQV